MQQLNHAHVLAKAYPINNDISRLSVSYRGYSRRILLKHCCKQGPCRLLFHLEANLFFVNFYNSEVLKFFIFLFTKHE